MAETHGIPLILAKPFFELKERLCDFEYALICGELAKAVRILECARDKMDELFRAVAEHHIDSTTKKS